MKSFLKNLINSFFALAIIVTAIVSATVFVNYVIGFSTLKPDEFVAVTFILIASLALIVVEIRNYFNNLIFSLIQKIIDMNTTSDAKALELYSVIKSLATDIEDMNKKILNHSGAILDLLNIDINNVDTNITAITKMLECYKEDLKVLNNVSIIIRDTKKSRENMGEALEEEFAKRVEAAIEENENKACKAIGKSTGENLKEEIYKKGGIEEANTSSVVLSSGEVGKKTSKRCKK